MLHRRTILVFVSAACVLISCGCQSTARDGASNRTLDGEPLYPHAAVATDHPLASQAGLAMLEQGGNAVDAAVAASFTLSVVRPYSCGIGGGGFMLIHLPPDAVHAEPRHIVLNYRETAPAAVTGAYYVELDDEEASRFGVHAAGVPGTVAGLLHALDVYGTLDRTTVLEPAIAAAEQGFHADANHIRVMNDLRELLEERPARGEHFRKMWSVLFSSGAMEAGDIVRNPQQAQALRMIAARGAEAFYQGEIADAIVSVMQASGGPITHDDLAHYAVDVRKPLRGRFQQYDVIAMPPPSSGGIALIQILGMIDRRLVEFGHPAHNSPTYVHLVTEAMKHAFADRAEWLADDAFVDVPVERLISDSYLDDLASRIDRHRTLDDRFAYGSVTPTEAGPDEQRKQAPDHGALPGDTSHLSVIDEHGMAVAATETINLYCGSLVEVPGFGFMLNNEMDDFTTIPGAPNAFGLRQSDRNLPEPGKRPLSSMSPTIVTRDGRAVLIIGASGGPRIITATAQVMLNTLMHEMPPWRAVAQPRFHHQWMPDELMFETDWDKAKAQAWLEIQAVMETYGHAIGEIPEVGVVQVIRGRQDRHQAASDPRKGGEPAGY